MEYADEYDVIRLAMILRIGSKWISDFLRCGFVRCDCRITTVS